MHEVNRRQAVCFTWTTGMISLQFFLLVISWRKKEVWRVEGWGSPLTKEWVPLGRSTLYTCTHTHSPTLKNKKIQGRWFRTFCDLWESTELFPAYTMFPTLLRNVHRYLFPTAIISPSNITTTNWNHSRKLQWTNVKRLQETVRV